MMPNLPKPFADAISLLTLHGGACSVSAMGPLAGAFHRLEEIGLVKLESGGEAGGQPMMTARIFNFQSNYEKRLARIDR